MALAHAIVGREAELQPLREFLDGPGPPHVVFVEGDAGVGKTALLEAVVERRRDACAPRAAHGGGGRELVRGAARPAPACCWTGSTRCPRRSAARSPRRCCSRTPPARSTRGWSRSPACRCSPRCPATCCSRSTTGSGSTPPRPRVLTFVLRRLEPGGAKVIATVRSGEADDALATLVRALPEGHALELVVAPLDAPALAGLVHARTGERLTPRALARLHGACARQPADGARADPRAGGGHRDGRAAAARPPDRGAPARLARAPPVVAALAEPTVDAVGDGRASRRRSPPTSSSATATGSASATR